MEGGQNFSARLLRGGGKILVQRDLKALLRLEDTYGTKIRPLLHVSPDNSVIRPSFKNLRDNFLTK